MYNQKQNEAVAKIFSNILLERQRQDAKWGDQSANKDTVWTTVLTEEVGEAAKEALGYEFDIGASKTIYLAHLREELIQCAAVCVAWLEAIDKRNDV